MIGWPERVVPPGTSPDPLPRVAILGAGLSGLGMAIRLLDAGIRDVMIFDKGDRVGGTWRDNTYPGAACDVPSHLYSLSFAPKKDWTRKFAEQPEILDYIEGLVEAHGLGPHLQLSTEVAAADWDDGAQVWRIRTTGGEEHEAEIFVAATGQLNRPHIPEIDGLEEFGGTAFHSARWDHDHDLSGENVAVVGNGASAIQFVPPVAEQARSVTIFQRSAPYILPKPDRAFTEREQWVFENVPLADRLYRWWIYWNLEARFLALQRDSRLGAWMADRFRDAIETRVVSDDLPEEAVLPDYPIGCKRVLITNDYLPTLKRPNVSVVLDPIERIDRDGVVTAEGTRHEVDTIIFGTGFAATEFLVPVDITGLDGRRLHEVWKDGAEAHLGTVVAGFPNLFILYGPNTNLGHNSILFMVESQIHYILSCLGRMLRDDAGAIDVSQAAMDRFNDEIDERMRGTSWAAQCHSWYKTATGKVTNNWPGFTVQYWLRTRRPDWDALVLTPRRERSPELLPQ